MEETFEQKVIRNIQGNFALYKTTEVVGSKSSTPNLEWVESDEVDKFFAFARNLGAKVIYVTEADEEDEEGNTRNSIIQVGFLHQSIMHHINLVEEEDDDEDDYEYVEEDDSDESDEEVIYEKEQATTSNQNPVEQNPQFNQGQPQNQFGHQQQPQQQQQQQNNNPQGNPPNGFIGQNYQR